MFLVKGIGANVSPDHGGEVEPLPGHHAKSEISCWFSSCENSWCNRNLDGWSVTVTISCMTARIDSHDDDNNDVHDENGDHHDLGYKAHHEQKSYHL